MEQIDIFKKEIIDEAYWTIKTGLSSFEYILCNGYGRFSAAQYQKYEKEIREKLKFEHDKLAAQIEKWQKEQAKEENTQSFLNGINEDGGFHIEKD